MTSKTSSGGCLKYGCFGCLALFILLIAAALLLGAIMAGDDGDPQPEQVRAEHGLPPAPPQPPQAPNRIYEEGDVPVNPEEPGLRVELPETSELAMPELSSGVGRLELDIEMGELIIRPGPAGEPLRIEADYDTKSFQLDQEMTDDGNGNWTYRVGFTGRAGWLSGLFGNSGKHNRIEIIVPRGYPLDIVGTVAKGKSEIDLGGLWVRDVDLEMSMGEHFIEFSEPLPYPMEDFNVNGSMGDLEIQGLGQAGPERASLGHSMGNFSLDLRGDWRRDSVIEIDFSMGDCRVTAPENARLNVDGVRMSMGDKRFSYDADPNLPADAPMVTLHADGSMGSLRVED